MELVISRKAHARSHPRIRQVLLLGLILIGPWQFPQAQTSQGVTHIEVTGTILRQDVQRMGVNLGEQNYYDSGQMLKNLVARNPGFEGMEYRSIVRCANITGNVCITDGEDALPEGFWKDAACEWLDAPSVHTSCTVAASSKAKKSTTLHLSIGVSGHGSYLILRKNFPGDPTAGWWQEATHGGTFSAETKDLSPQTEGRQALRMSAGDTGQTAAIVSYFDSTEGRTFLRMHGRYRIHFLAKAIAGAKSIKVSLGRISTPPDEFLTRSVSVGNAWQDFNIEFAANDAPAAKGAVRLSFEIAGSVVLLDDVSLERLDGDKSNPTVFRDEVVAALRDLHPGVLRYMGSSTELGASIGNLLAPTGARMRSAYSLWNAQQEDISLGLPDFLGLCRTVGADPWIVVPAATSETEIRQLISYMNQWTSVFSTIHLELGNEVWNSIYRGASIEDPVVYGIRAAKLFAVARATPGFVANRFDLILGGQVTASERNQQMLDASSGYDSLAVAPYLMHWANDDSSLEKLFAPLLAEPEMMETNGAISQNRQAADRAIHASGLSVYEVNLHTTEGRISQFALDHLTSSMGAGLALADHMLLMLREDNVRAQALFSLAGFENRRSDGKHVLLWGSVVDMGVTNRRRPQFLAVEMINQALLRTMVTTRQSGYDPTWMQYPGNDDVALQKAHALQSFAFQDGPERSLVLLNLSRDQQLVVNFTGAHPPGGRVSISTLHAEALTDTNEDEEKVRIARSEVNNFLAAKLYILPPGSMTVLRWRTQ